MALSIEQPLPWAMYSWGLGGSFRTSLKSSLRKVNLLLVDLKAGGLLPAENIFRGPQSEKSWKMMLQNHIEAGQEVLTYSMFNSFLHANSKFIEWAWPGKER